MPRVSPRRPLRVGADALPPCVECGCCCFSTDADYIRLFEIDLARMDARARSYTHDEGRGATMRMRAGRCAALTIDAAARTFVCAIYAQRPDVCRWLEPGTGVCLDDRSAKRERPLLAVASLLRPSDGESGPSRPRS